MTTSLLEFAIQYHNRGLAIVPVNGKAPTVKGWQKTRLSENEINRHFSNGGVTGIGVIAGEMSGNLGVLDFDKPGWKIAYDHFLHSWCDDIPYAPILQTGSGKRHIWVVCPDMPITHTVAKFGREITGHDTNNNPIYAQIIELRGNRSNCVCPPSLHPSGDRYKWLVTESELPEVPFSELYGWLSDWGTLITAQPKTTQLQLETSGQKSPLPQRTLQFIASDEPLPEGNRNSELYAASQQFAAANYTQTEAIKILKPAAETVGLNKNEIEPTIKSGFNAAKESGFQPIIGKYDPDIETTFNTLTIREALEEPAPNFLVQDYIVENTINFIVGPPAAAKTFFALDLAIEMIRPNLGLMAQEWDIPKPLKVLYMTDEGQGTIFSKNGRLISMLAQKGLYDPVTDKLHPCCDNLMFVTDMLNLFENTKGRFDRNDGYIPSRFEIFVKQFYAFQPDVIFIDTYANATIGGEENSNKESNVIGRHMRQLKGDMNCSLILLHHTAKGIVIAKGNPYVGRGAGSLGGFSDTIIGLMPDSDNEDCSIMVHCKPKHGRLQPSRLMTRVENPPYYYPYLEWSHYADKVQQQVKQKQDDILTALQEFGAMNLRKIMEATGLPESTANRQLKDLVKSNQINRQLKDPDKPASKSNPFVYEVITI